MEHMLRTKKKTLSCKRPLRETDFAKNLQVAGARDYVSLPHLAPVHNVPTGAHPVGIWRQKRNKFILTSTRGRDTCYSYT